MLRRLADLTGLHELYDDAPAVRAGWVVSADGAASRDGSSRPLSGAADRAVLRALRAVAGAVVVGAGTARAEGYGPVPLPEDLRAWRIARGLPGRPPLVVVTRSGALDPASRLFAGPTRTTVLTCSAADVEALRGVADVFVAGDDEVDLRAGLAALGRPGGLLVEGGPTLLGDLLRLGLVDEACLTVAPLLAGQAPGAVGGAMPVAVPLVLRQALEHDGALLLRYDIAR